MTEYSDDASILQAEAGAFQHKLIIHSHGQRLTYGAAVHYANTRLAKKIIAISTADVGPAGEGWSNLTLDLVRGRLFGLSRYENPKCFGACDCRKAFSGCYDTFVFVSPLSGGADLIRATEFRLGSLWGSENRFLFEVKKFNPAISVSNPCYSLTMNHHHCAGSFRPEQDQARINDKGSLEPEPCDLFCEGCMEKCQDRASIFEKIKKVFF